VLASGAHTTADTAFEGVANRSWRISTGRLAAWCAGHRRRSRHARCRGIL